MTFHDMEGPEESERSPSPGWSPRREDDLVPFSTSAPTTNPLPRWLPPRSTTKIDLILNDSTMSAPGVAPPRGPMMYEGEELVFDGGFRPVELQRFPAVAGDRASVPDMHSVYASKNAPSYPNYAYHPHHPQFFAASPPVAPLGFPPRPADSYSNFSRKPTASAAPTSRLVDAPYWLENSRISTPSSPQGPGWYKKGMLQSGFAPRLESESAPRLESESGHEYSSTSRLAPRPKLCKNISLSQSVRRGHPRHPTPLFRDEMRDGSRQYFSRVAERAAADYPADLPLPPPPAPVVRTIKSVIWPTIVLPFDTSDHETVPTNYSRVKPRELPPGSRLDSSRVRPLELHANQKPLKNNVPRNFHASQKTLRIAPNNSNSPSSNSQSDGTPSNTTSVNISPPAAPPFFDDDSLPLVLPDDEYDDDSEPSRNNCSKLTLRLKVQGTGRLQSARIDDRPIPGNGTSTTTTTSSRLGRVKADTSETSKEALPEKSLRMDEIRHREARKRRLHQGSEFIRKLREQFTSFCSLCNGGMDVDDDVVRCEGSVHPCERAAHASCAFVGPYRGDIPSVHSWRCAHCVAVDVWSPPGKLAPALPEPRIISDSKAESPREENDKAADDDESSSSLAF